MTDYLLKPITAAKLLEAVKKVADVIEKEREDARLMDKYRLEMAENTVLERQRLLRDLVTGRVNFKEAWNAGSRWGWICPLPFTSSCCLSLCRWDLPWPIPTGWYPARKPLRNGWRAGSTSWFLIGGTRDGLHSHRGV